MNVPAYTPPMAVHPTITATGIKGFLLWMKTDPNMSLVYKQIKPQLQNVLVNGRLTSSYGASTLNGPDSSGMPRGHGRWMSGLGALGCCFGYCDYSGPVSNCSATLPTVVPPECISGTPINFNDSTTSIAPQDSVSSAALINSISGLLNTGASVALTANQIQTANTITNAQLQRAAAGLPPLNLTTGPAGLTTISGVGMSSDTLLLLGGAALVLLLVMSKKKSS